MKDSKDFELLVEGDRCSLVIHEVYLEDSGEYKCTARNIHGMAHTSCRLMVEREYAPRPMRSILHKHYIRTLGSTVH